MKVEGDFRNNTLLAEEVEGREGDAELDGIIQQIDLDNELLVVSGVRVQLTANTLIDDDDSDNDLRNRVDDINAFSVGGDYVEVEGRQRTDHLEAFTIEREDSDEDDNFELEARIDAISDTSLTVMNLEILLNGFSVAGLQVGDEAEVEYDQTIGGEYVLTANPPEN